MYDPILETCIIQGTHRGLVNALGVLVVDVVLLMAMLIGLLRHANRSSTGIWQVLYQQVTPNLSSYAGY
jgi:threonine/homoserine/homoserine lactone efflux protein